MWSNASLCLPTYDSLAKCLVCARLEVIYGNYRTSICCFKIAEKELAGPQTTGQFDRRAIVSWRQSSNLL